eukprot:708482-Rhodomonas_salina.4
MPHGKFDFAPGIVLAGRCGRGDPSVRARRGGGEEEKLRRGGEEMKVRSGGAERKVRRGGGEMEWRVQSARTKQQQKDSSEGRGVGSAK